MGHQPFAHQGPRLEWVGPLAFARQHPDPQGTDLLLGDTWGPRVDQTIFWRRDPGRDTGVLCAYDPLWDEYTVLAANLDRDLAGDAYLAALREPRGHRIERLAVVARQVQHARPASLSHITREPEL